MQQSTPVFETDTIVHARSAKIHVPQKGEPYECLPCWLPFETPVHDILRITRFKSAARWLCWKHPSNSPLRTQKRDPIESEIPGPVKVSKKNAKPTIRLSWRLATCLRIERCVKRNGKRRPTMSDAAIPPSEFHHPLYLIKQKTTAPSILSPFMPGLALFSRQEPVARRGPFPRFSPSSRNASRILRGKGSLHFAFKPLHRETFPIHGSAICPYSGRGFFFPAPAACLIYGVKHLSVVLLAPFAHVKTYAFAPPPQKKKKDLVIGKKQGPTSHSADESPT